MKGGTALSSGSFAGGVTIEGGSGFTHANGGAVTITGGSTTGTGTDGGAVTIGGGTASDGVGGSVTIESGTPGGSNAAGIITLRTADGSTDGGNLWIDLGIDTGDQSTNGAMILNSTASNKSPQLQFREAATNGTNYIALAAPDNTTASQIWYLPQDSWAAANGKFITSDGSGNWSFATPASVPAGSDTEVQFNNSGSMGASSDFTWDDTAKVLTVIGQDGPSVTPPWGVNDVVRVNNDFASNIHLATGPASAGTSQGAIKWSQEGQPAFSGRIIYVHDSGAQTGHFLFNTQGSSVEAMRITNESHVGIGTSSPDGTLHVTGADSGNGVLTIEQTGVVGNVDAASIHFIDAEATLTNYTEYYIRKNDDRLQIGAIQPSDDTTSQLFTAFAAENGVGVSPWTSAWLQINGYSRIVWTNENSGELRFQTGGSTSGDERMRITAAGEVLIGSSTANAALYVDGFADQSQLRIDSHSTQTTDAIVAYNSLGNKYLRIHENGKIQIFSEGTSFPRLSLISDVAEGTSKPTLHLTEQADISVTGGTDWEIRYDVALANRPLEFKYDGVELMTLTSGGELYIGTTTDVGTFKLQAFGNAHLRDKLEVRNATDTLGSVAGDELTILRTQFATGNAGFLDIKAVRTSAGTGWGTSATRIQATTDSTEQAYIDFNGTDNNYGVTIGTGIGGTPTDSVYFTSNGHVLAGSTTDNGKVYIKNDDADTVALRVDANDTTQNSRVIEAYNPDGKFQFGVSDNAAKTVSFVAIEGDGGASLTFEARDDPNTTSWHLRNDDLGHFYLRYPGAAGSSNVLNFNGSTGVVTHVNMRCALTIAADAGQEPLIVKTGDSTELARITESGEMLIGTSTPAGRFQVSNNPSTGDNVPLAVFDATGGISGGIGEGIEIRSYRPGVVWSDKSTNSEDFRWGSNQDLFKLSIDTDGDDTRDVDGHFDDIPNALVVNNSGTIMVNTATDSGSGAKVQVNGNVEAPNVGFMIWGERGGTLAVSNAFAFGNGFQNNFGLTVPFDGTITYLTYSAGDATGNLTVTVYINNVASAATIAPNGVQRMVQTLGTPLSVNAGDSVAFVVTALTTAPTVPAVVGAFYQST